MSLILERATPEDAHAIATIWVIAMNDAIALLKFGTANRDDLISFLTGFVKKEMATLPDWPYFVIKDETGTVISYAQWIFPREPVEKKSTSEQDRLEEDYGCYLGAPEGVNFSFLPDYHRTIHEMQHKAIEGRPHFMLGNLATHPEHERKGAASRLVSWVFEEANRRQVPLYLDTPINGPGRALYSRLGFREVATCEWDFEKYGGTGKHGLVAMIREPNGVM